MVKKYFVPTVLAIAFVSLLVFLSTRYLSKKSPAWENYQNKQLGIEFSYPKDELLIKHKNINNDNGSFEFRNLETLNPGTNSEQFSISGEVVSTISIPKELLQSSTDPNSTKLLNDPGLIYGFIGDPPYSAYITYFPLSDNKYYEVAVRFSYVEEGKVLPLAKKILSTFKVNPATSTWKTYQNEKYGFEFQYPSSWEQVADNFTTSSIFYNLKETRPIIVTIADKSKESTCGPYLCYSSISVYPPYKNLSFLTPKKWIEDFYIKNNITDKSNFEKFNFEQSVANGASYLRNNNSVFIFVDNRVFLVELQIQNGVNETNLTDTYNQILQTIKFVPHTSTWKTYQNSKYGFEIKLPPQYRAVEKENFRDGIWGLEVSDTSEKVKDMTGKLISKPVFYIRLSSQFIYNPDATTPKIIEAIRGNTFSTFKATKYEMYDIYYFERNGLLFVSEQENLHLTNPYFDQILTSLKFTKTR